MSISLILNGASISARADTLSQLLAERLIDTERRFVAVAVNNVVVPRGEWPRLRLRDGDRVEIVQPMKGG
jgi:sulfur carrier protein